MFGINLDLEYIIFAIISASIIVFLGLIHGGLKEAYKFFEKQNIQGPKPTFFIGTWRGSINKFLGDEDISLAKQYGKIVGTFDGLTPNILTTHPDIIKQILSLSTDNFCDRRVSITKNPVLQESLLSLCGEEDKEVQKFIASLLTEEKIEKLLPRLDTSTSTLAHNITKIVEENNNIQLTTLIEEFIQDLISLAVFGIDLNSDGEFREEFLKYLEQIFWIQKKPTSYLSLIRFVYPEIQGDSWIIPQKALKYFTDLISSGIKETPRNAVATEGKTAHLIDLLVEASEEEKKLVKKAKNEDRILTDEVITCKCLSSILALVNSARTTILFTIYELARNQEVQEKLSNEIQSNKSDKLSCTDLKNCRYLDMILNEVLRLYPFEFRLEKICTKRVKLGPIKVENGNIVSVPLFPLHHSDEYYPEAEKFDPERFTPEATEKRNPYTYLPFGQAGLNGSNLSLQLSVLVSKVAIYKLVDKLKFSKSGEEDQVLFETGITGVPVPANLKVAAELRSK